MIVGHGMMARAFSAYQSDPHILIFASGVSDSNESRGSEFERERDLLVRTREQHPDKLFVYFGTCSVNDPERRATPYVRHKLDMEAFLLASGDSAIVLRVPLAIGPRHETNTLVEHIYRQISEGNSFDVWMRATRYPIDVEDVFRIATRLIQNRSLRDRTINIALRSFPVLDFVRVLEQIVGKPARFRALDKGGHYRIECPEVIALRHELNLDYSANYLRKVLQKYFSLPAP